MKLFEDKIRDNYDRANSGENIYKYFDNNQQSHIVKIRDILNKWFENYSEDYKKDLKDSFKNHFYNSFYELFIHELFFNQGFVLEPHPTIQGTLRKPDFLAIKGKQKIYIEATTISYVSEIEQKKENFREKFIDELDEISSTNFWLGLLELKFKKNNFPKVGKIRKAFEQKLLEIDPNEIEKTYKESLRKNILKYEDDSILIEVSIMNKSETAKQEKNLRTIGIRTYPVIIQNADVDSDKIFKSFKDKATRYGVFKYPYIICLNLDFRFNLKHDVDCALYQQNTFYSTTPKFSRVSAVFATNLSVGNIFDVPSHRFILNKNSSLPLNIEDFLLTYETDIEEIILQSDINDLLNLNVNKVQDSNFK